MKIRKHLSADGLFRLVRTEFGKIEEHRPMNVGSTQICGVKIGIRPVFSNPLPYMTTRGSLSPDVGAHRQSILLGLFAPHKST